MRCATCAKLTVRRLFPYIEREPFHMHTRDVQLTAGELACRIAHHPSYLSLFLSSENGCDLCRLLADQFECHGLLARIRRRMAQKESTNIEISLRCARRDERPCTYDTLYVTCGKTLQGDMFWPNFSAKEREGFVLKLNRKRSELCLMFWNMVRNFQASY